MELIKLVLNYFKKMIPVVNKETFKDNVLNNHGMVLVNFWAWWNDECRNMSILMHKVVSALDEYDKIVQVDWDQQKRLAQELEVFGVPTLLIYVGGTEVARYSGSMSKGGLLKRIVEAKNTKNKKYRSTLL